VPKPYPPEFRRRALELVANGRTVRDVAASLGLAESCLYRWKSQDLIDRGLKPGVTTSESAELADARRRIRELEDEVKILRKAATTVDEVMRPKARFQLVAELVADGVEVRRSTLVATDAGREVKERTLIPQRFPAATKPESRAAEGRRGSER
jgi:transposase-like protein